MNSRKRIVIALAMTDWITQVEYPLYLYSLMLQANCRRNAELWPFEIWFAKVRWGVEMTAKKFDCGAGDGGWELVRLESKRIYSEHQR